MPEAGTFVAFILASFVATTGGQADVTLTCPEKWVEGEVVTLTCEVSKASVGSKCAAPVRDSTFFLHTPPGGSLDPLCTVDAADYASCDFPQDSSAAPPECGCRQNDTYYTFVYRLQADREAHTGNWGCTKACNPSSGLDNPLTSSISSYCTNVEVLEKGAEETNEKAGGLQWWGVLLIVLAVGAVVAVTVVLFIKFKNKSGGGKETVYKERAPADDPQDV